MGDITSGDVKDDAAANMDFGGGGGDGGGYEEAAYGGSKSDFYSTPQPSGGGGGYEEAAYGGSKSGFYSTSVPTVSPPSTSFQLGFGGSPEGTNIAQDYMNNLNTLMGGGGSSADASAVSVSDQPSSVPGVPDFVTIGGGTSKPDTKPQPVPGVPDFVSIGGGTSKPGDTRPDPVPGVPDFVAIGGGTSAQDTRPPIPGVPDFVAIGGGTSMSPGAVPFSGIPPEQTFEQQPKADVNQLAKYYEGLIAGKGSPKNEQEKTLLGKIQDFLKKPGSTILGFLQSLFQGDPNFTGPSPAQLDLMGVPGPGPEVGGGVPSPSGGGDAGGTPQNPIYSGTPAETIMKKDPCPPGFKLDPILNQCMPIVKSAPTPPPMPTLPQPTAPTGGGIANVYPFTLTPPVGAPVGTVAPIRFTPK